MTGYLRMNFSLEGESTRIEGAVDVTDVSMADKMIAMNSLMQMLEMNELEMLLFATMKADGLFDDPKVLRETTHDGETVRINMGRIEEALKNHEG